MIRRKLRFLRMVLGQHRLIGRVTTIIILPMKKRPWWSNYAENLTEKTEKNHTPLYLRLRWSIWERIHGTKKRTRWKKLPANLSVIQIRCIRMSKIMPERQAFGIIIITWQKRRITIPPKNAKT